LINNVYTQQDDGFMTSEISKRGANGDMFLYHGRYTTCDLPHPDFYFAMSRAKVRPGKDVVFGPTYLVVADVPLPFAVSLCQLMAMRPHEASICVMVAITLLSATRWT
jgi:hypothetical protein